MAAVSGRSDRMTKSLTDTAPARKHNASGAYLSSGGTKGEDFVE